ncbi:hypothetical protein CYMTET_22249, partial [Cymbomonas tetramitiformis]
MQGYEYFDEDLRHVSKAVSSSTFFSQVYGQAPVLTFTGGAALWVLNHEITTVHLAVLAGFAVLALLLLQRLLLSAVFAARRLHSVAVSVAKGYGETEVPWWRPGLSSYPLSSPDMGSHRRNRDSTSAFPRKERPNQHAVPTEAEGGSPGECPARRCSPCVLSPSTFGGWRLARFMLLLHGATSFLAPLAHGCASDCYQYTCDYWYENGYECNVLEDTYGCDCTGCSCGGTPEPSPGTGDEGCGVLPVIIRDFKKKQTADWEMTCKNYGYATGAPEDDLGPEGKMVWSGTWNNRDPFSTEENFNQWYRDIEGVNMRAGPSELALTEQSGGTFVFNDQSFFPIDNQGYGNEGKSHNYYFTLESYSRFLYNGGEVFEFSGDDDLWVYIDGKLVIDLGGIHGSQTRSVSLDSLGLTLGETYSLHLFFAERCPSESHFKFSRTFSSFNNANPGTSGLVELHLGGTACSSGNLASSFSTRTSGSFTTAKEQAAVLRVIVRTSQIHHDRHGISAQYLVVDGSGRPQVELAGLEVQMVVTNDESATITSICDLPASDTGSGDCLYDDAELLSWFSTSASSSASLEVKAVYSGVTAAKSPAMSVVLAAEVGHAAMTRPGMALSMPQSPRFAGDSFTSQVYGHTGGYALSTFGLTVRYDTSVLRYIAIAGDAKYLAPTVNDYTEGQLVALASGLADGVTNADVTGDAIELATVQFAVVSDVEARTYSGVLNCTVKEMVSTSSVQLDGTVNAPAQINDEQGGAVYEGQLSVQATEVRGVYAYASAAELFNTGVLAGGATTCELTVMEVYNQVGVEDTVAAAAACTITSAAVASVSDCVVAVGEEHTAGADAVEVAVQAGPHSSSVTLRVWFPQDVSIWVIDAELNAIAGASQVGSCTQPRFQSTAVGANATFGGAGLTSVSGLDVSCMVEFASRNSTVLEVDGTTAHGLSAGQAEIYLSGGAAALGAAGEARLAVVESEVTVQHLSGVLATGARWDAVESSSVSLDAGTQLALRVTLEQALTKEGDGGPIFTYAQFSDLMVAEVKQAQGAVVTVHPDFAACLEVSDDTESSADVKGVVPSGGESGSSSAMLLVAWKDECTGADITTGIGEVTVSLSPPVSAVITAEHSQIARPSDPAAANPISTPAWSALTVVMTYADGTTKDLTKDSRTRLSVVSGAHLLTVNSTTASATAIENATDFGSGTVMATFPGYKGAEAITASVAVEIVGLDHLTLFTSPYPPYSGSSTVAETMLSVVHCSGAYQRATMTLTATLTDLSTREVTSTGEYTSSSSSGLGLRGTELVAAVPGEYTVAGAFEGVSSSHVAITVTDDVAFITSVQHTTSWDADATFHGYQNETRALQLSVGLSDGALLTDVVGGIQSGWIAVHELLAFTSDSPASITVDSSGAAALLANHYDTVGLAAQAANCSAVSEALPSAEDTVKANLAPRVNDVDLGNEYGLQFDVVTAESHIEVPVWIETGSATLNVFDILLTFDPSHLEATSCSVGSAWSSYGFTCTLSDPAEEVLITGVEISTDVQGLVQLATVRFKVHAGFTLTALSATVQGLQTSKTEVSSSYGAVAGRGLVAQSARHRRRHLQHWRQAAEDAVTVQAHRQRQRQERRVLQNVGEYLQYVYANFLRFVKLETQADAEPEISGGEMTMSVAIYDKSSVPVASDTTVVQYELGTTQNTDMQRARGLLVLSVHGVRLPRGVSSASLADASSATHTAQFFGLAPLADETISTAPPALKSTPTTLS